MYLGEREQRIHFVLRKLAGRLEAVGVSADGFDSLEAFANLDAEVFADTVTRKALTKIREKARDALAGALGKAEDGLQTEDHLEPLRTAHVRRGTLAKGGANMSVKRLAKRAAKAGGLKYRDLTPEQKKQLRDAVAADLASGVEPVVEGGGNRMSDSEMLKGLGPGVKKKTLDATRDALRNPQPGLSGFRAP